MPSIEPRTLRVSKWILPFGILLTALGVSLFEMRYISQPGTMDACYYYDNSLTLAGGGGFMENFIWNFLDDPAGLPHPGNAYWMPVSSLVGAVGVALFHGGFSSAQIPFLILAAFFPLAVYGLARRWTGSSRISIAAAFLAIFSGFFAIYWVNTETFLLYAWIGLLFFALWPEVVSSKTWYGPAALGLVCSVAYLTRADGILILGTALLVLVLTGTPGWKQRWKTGIWILVGFAPLCLAWFYRNQLVFGSILAPGGSRALWLVTYNDLFHYPALEITWQRFLSAGSYSFFSTRWTALLWNGQNLIFVLGLVFLSPLMVVGWVSMRRHPSLKLAAAYLSVLFFVMTIIFPLQGSRGGFLHSSAALIPVAVICAAAGLERLVANLAKWRSRAFGPAENVFYYGFVLLAAMTTCLIFQYRVLGNDVANPSWSRMDSAYSIIQDRLRNEGYSNPRVMVNNPPCFVYRTGWSAVAVPDGDIETALAVADKYLVEFLVLDDNSPSGLLGLYQGEESNPRIILLQTIHVEQSTIRVFSIH